MDTLDEFIQRQLDSVQPTKPSGDYWPSQSGTNQRDNKPNIEDRRDDVPAFAAKPFLGYHPFHASDAAVEPSVTTEGPYWHVDAMDRIINSQRRR